jgi:prepilin-type N-terminal cleavage/methylation domain-containing protein
MSRVHQTEETRQGFTVIEMLWAMVIIALLAGCVFAAYAAGLKIYQRARSGNHDLRQRHLILEQMCQEMETMLRYDLSRSYPKRRSVDGGPDAVTFFVAGPDGLQGVTYRTVPLKRARRHTVRVRFRHQGNTPWRRKIQAPLPMIGLKRSQRPWVDVVNRIPAGPDQARIMATGLAPDGLRFYYATRSDETAGKVQWLRHWDRPGLPAAIRVETDYLAPHRAQGRRTLVRLVLIPTGE